MALIPSLDAVGFGIGMWVLLASGLVNRTLDFVRKCEKFVSDHKKLPGIVTRSCLRSKMAKLAKNTRRDAG